ncbi:MAG TPA: type II toxin-antitoxin system prevent-host-death family antitoxin [Geminicoccaceae bacterium]|nr:type II toxin-antitoxin system prevent-host-death family antitoxin [Geminicoccaceae bacterium]
MSAITAREANQQFSKLLQRAEAGEEVVITKRGKAVAKLVPVDDARADSEVEEKERQRREVIAWLQRGALRGGKVVDWTRDELYDRDDRSDVE